MASMAQDLLRFAQGTRLGTAFSAAKLGCALLGLASAGLLVRLAVPFSRDLLLSTVPSLCTTVRGYLVPPYIFVVVNFIIFVIMKLPDTKNPHHHHQSPKESPVGIAATAAAPATDPPKPQKDLSRSSPAEASTNVWPDAAPFAAAPLASPPAGIDDDSSSPGAWSDESSLTADFEGDSASSPPPAAVAARAIAQSVAEIRIRAPGGPQPTGEGELEEEDGQDSMDATWKAITGGEAGRRRLRKNETWSAPPRVHLDPAGGAPALRREMRRSETFRHSPPPPSPSPTTTRRLVVERRVNWREIPMAPDDADDINRQFEAFIKKGKDQMRLQREESAAQRYMEMVKSPGY